VLGEYHPGGLASQKKWRTVWRSRRFARLISFGLKLLPGIFEASGFGIGNSRSFDHTSAG
jgi:hypothetical protein